MMGDLPSLSPSLGTFSHLPREIRDRIYGYVLNFNNPDDHQEIPLESHCCCKHASHRHALPRTALLRVSRCISAESIIRLYQVNEFGIWIEHDTRNPANKSVIGKPGYKAYIAHNRMFQELSVVTDDSFFEIPPDMTRYLQNVVLNIGTLVGLTESDIVPSKKQTRCGPERPTFAPLVSVVEEVCEMLQRCYSVHRLRLSVRSIEKTPGSIEKVMNPIRQLREIKRTNPTIYSMKDDNWVDWNLKGSYGRYLNRILGMPSGCEAPKYVGDEKDPNQSEDNIFDKIGGRWVGGRTFAYHDDSGSESEGEGMDGWDEYDGFEEFLGDMFGSMHHFHDDFDDADDQSNNSWETEEEDDLCGLVEDLD